MTLHLLWEEYRQVARRGGVRLQPVLRDLPALGAEAQAVDAPGAPGGREDLRRLLGQAAPPRGPEDRRGDPGRAVRGRARGEQLHLRRGDPEPEAPRLGRRRTSGCWSTSAARTELWVPDQLKSAVTRPCRYEPGVNRSYQELAAPLRRGGDSGPARQGAGQGARSSRWCWSPSAGSWPACATAPSSSSASSTRPSRELLEELNDRPMQKIGESRRELWEQLDRPALKALPITSLRAGRVEDLPRQHRLPRRGRPPPLQRALPARRRAGGGALHQHDRRDLLQGPPPAVPPRDATTASPRRWPSTCRARTGRTRSGRPRG